MCCLIVEIIMFVMGIVGVTQGKVSLTRKRVATGPPARIAGALLLVPLPAYIIANVVVGASILGQGQAPDPQIQAAAGVVSLLAIGLSLLCFVAAIVICAVTAQPISKKRKEPDEGEEPFERRDRRRSPPDERIQE